jgi:hypothetical protein
MSNHYKLREQNLRKIIKENIEPKAENSNLNLCIYYKSRKLQHLLLSNRVGTVGLEDENNVVYQYTCNSPECKVRDLQYIGYTTNSIKIRMSQHCRNGAIRKHIINNHNETPNVQ